MFETSQDRSNSYAPQTPPLTNVETSGGDDAADFAENRAFDRASALGKLKLSRGNIILIGLFAAGIASVYFLSLRKGPEAASASDRAVEQQVNNFIAGSSDSARPRVDNDTRKVVESLYHYAARHQVPLDNLKGNPFVFTEGRNARRAAAPQGPTAAETAVAKRYAEVEAEFSRLQLQSIMMGPRGGTAIINNNFLTEGQRIGSLTVAKITPRTVELAWNNEVFTLRITE